MEQFVTPNNPLDLATAQSWPDDAQRRLFDAFLASGFDIALQCMSFPPENTWEDESWYRSAAIFAAAAKAAELPAAFVSPTHEGLPRKARDMLAGLGVAPLQGFHDGLRAIAHAVRYGENRRRDGNAMRLPDFAPVEGRPVQTDEAAAKTLLSAAGLPVPQGIVWNGGDPPVTLVYPVALKLCDPALTHKSEIGGVALHISSERDLLAAAKTMAETARANGYADHRFLIESMIEGGIGELLIGIRNVPGIGQALTLAAGGVTAELLGDATTLLLPAAREDVQRALGELRLFPLLNGWRGRPRADLAAAIDTILSLSVFAASHRDTLLALEINPLILRAAGCGVVAADAVLQLTEKG